jgi:hypothetical protein
MANQVLRDSRGVKIGEIQKIGEKLIIRDATGMKRGEYTTQKQIRLVTREE